MDPPSAIAIPSQFLEDARPFPGENKFILGTFERGITFYRQQIRALNLVYSLVEAKDVTGAPEIAPGSCIVIVGGGAFGITAAAAAAYAGFQVVLLERQQDLLHLQHNCDTRWLHPRFYDWPAPESESRLARLPILDWAASTAGQVAAELQSEFFDLVRKKSGALRCVLEVSEFAILGRRNDIYEFRYRTRTGQDIVPCAVILYAVGFGTEVGENAPYWRNDQLGQTELDFTGGKKVRYVVSGVGDGGLIDVFRLTIHDFRHEHIFSEMFGSPDNPLLSKLRTLANASTLEAGWLYDQFRSIETEQTEAMANAMARLKSRQRSDTEVTLNGTDDSLRQSLTLDRVSLSNALLAYCLFRINAIRYEAGTLDTTDPRSPRLRGADAANAQPPWLVDVKLIVRHGTDRERALRDVGCEAAIDFMKKQKNIRDSGQAIFPAGWWGRYTAPADAANDDRPPVPVEFVPPALMTHATTFVSTLGSILQFLIDSKSTDGTGDRQFRVTLHRLVRFDGREVFQQITPYAGRVATKAGFGRFFPVEGGIVGLACRTGSLVVARKTDAETFDKIWQLTNLVKSGAKPVKPYVDSIFACPFFAPETEGEPHHVSLVLFVDSAEASFFDSQVLGTISAACRGFVQLLENLHKSGALKPVPTFYPGYRVQPNPALKQLVAELKTLGVTFEDANVHGWKEGLTFKTLESLDVEVGSSAKFA
jgi:hypothetical protein